MAGRLVDFFPVVDGDFHVVALVIGEGVQFWVVVCASVDALYEVQVVEGVGGDGGVDDAGAGVDGVGRVVCGGLEFCLVFAD